MSIHCLSPYSVARASSNISVNTTSSEVCFTSSSSNCSLTDLTQYNVSIVDISGAEIFAEDNIPESKCVTVSQLDLLQQCGPFRVITRPFNDYIVYNQETRNIPPGWCRYYSSVIYNPSTSKQSKKVCMVISFGAHCREATIEC